MKLDIHPKYGPLKVACSCGNAFDTQSTVEKEVLNIEICSECHPYYTGKQKIIDTAGRVEKFQKRYTAKSMPQEKPAVAESVSAKAGSSKKAGPSKKVGKVVDKVEKTGKSSKKTSV
jgi:large subunit ribosomal protein L31